MYFYTQTLDLLDDIMELDQSIRSKKNIFKLNAKEDTYDCEVEFAGYEKENLKVTAEDSILVVSGEDKERDRNKEVRFYIPKKADASKIKAIYKNGLLKITLPMKEEKKPVIINIES